MLGVLLFKWFEPVEPFQIAGPIYYVGTRGLAVYIVKTDAGLVLLNGAMPGYENLVLNSVRELGFKLEDIRVILVSHGHADHAGTVAAIKRATNATVVAMEDDVGLLKSGGKADYLFSNVKFLHFESVVADKVLKDGDRFTFGNIEFVAHDTPGHTPGCATIETKVEAEGAMRNVVFADCLSVNPGTRFDEKNPSYPGIADDYRKAFRVMEEIQPDIFLAFHPEYFDLESKRERMKKEGMKVWINPEGYRTLVRKKKETFERFAR